MQDTMTEPEAAEAAIWTAWRERLRAFIGRRVANAHDVDDLMQDVAVRVLRHREQVDELEQPSAWLYRVARHAIIDHHRHGATATAHTAPLPDEWPADADDEEGSRQVLADAASWVRPFVDALPDDQREVIERVDLRGEPRDEVARALGLTMPALKARVRRGRLQLRRLIEKCCELELDARGEPMDFHRRPDGWSPCTSDSSDDADDGCSCDHD